MHSSSLFKKIRFDDSTHKLSHWDNMFTQIQPFYAPIYAFCSNLLTSTFVHSQLILALVCTNSSFVLLQFPVIHFDPNLNTSVNQCTLYPFQILLILFSVLSVWPSWSRFYRQAHTQANQFTVFLCWEILVLLLIARAEFSSFV